MIRVIQTSMRYITDDDDDWPRLWCYQK